MKQGELYCRCLETGAERCTRCDWTLEALQKADGRRRVWIRNVSAYLRPDLVVGTGRRSVELWRGGARFELQRDTRTGSLEVYVSGSGTFVGRPQEVFAAGAEPWPCNVSYAR